MITSYFNGTLSLSDSPQDMNRMNYLITDLVDGTKTSITDILDKIYSSPICNKLTRVALRVYDSNRIINKMGSLLIARDKFHVEGYHINSLPFELELFNLTGLNVELVLEDYTVTEDGSQHEDAIKIS